MKLTDILLLGLAVMFMVIGIDQAIVLGFNHAYWAFMLALVPFFVLNYRRSKRASSTPEEAPSKPPKKHKRNK
jgi:hypothetical protein